MLFGIYKTLTNLSEPLFKHHIDKRLAKGKEDAERLNERFGQPQKVRPDGKLIWLHAASVGESIALLSLINKLSDKYSDAHLMLTTGTVTSANIIKDRLPKNAFHQYLPVDVPKWTESFLDHWHPDIIIWSESDFWPNILSGAHKRKIPAVLLNAIISEEAFSKWNLFAKGFIKDILNTFDICLTQDNDEAERFIKLGAKNVKNSGNLKYAAKILPYKEDNLKSLKEAINGRPCILWASTHDPEEVIASEIHTNLIKEFPDLLTIILPRHPDRKENILKDIAKAGLTVSCRSEGKLPRKNDAIYLADTFGETGLFYKLKPLFVNGGTFENTGGHNIIEPSLFGCPIFYGPNMSTCLSIHKEFTEHSASIQASSKEHMQEILLEALRNPKEANLRGEKAKILAQEKTQVLEKVMSDINPFISKVLGNV